MKRTILILSLYAALVTPFAVNEADDLLRAHYTAAHDNQVESDFAMLAEALPQHLQTPLPVRKGEAQ